MSEKGKTFEEMFPEMFDSIRKNPHVQHAVIVYAPVPHKSRAGIQYYPRKRVKILLNKPVPLTK